MSKTPSSFAGYWETRIAILSEICLGLRGTPFTWSHGAKTSKRHLLKEFGITLVTKNQAKKLGYEINQRAKPVGKCWFNAPLSRYADVYVLECQCWKLSLPEGEVVK